MIKHGYVQVDRDTLRKCRCIRRYSASQRVQNAPISEMSWKVNQYSQSPTLLNKEWSATAPKATDIMVTHGFTGTLNMSQQINRMGVSELRAPCVTPKAFLWNFAEKRPFTGIDKLIFQCFPVDDMKLTCLEEPVASQHTCQKWWHQMIWMGHVRPICAE